MDRLSRVPYDVGGGGQIPPPFTVAALPDEATTPAADFAYAASIRDAQLKAYAAQCIRHAQNLTSDATAWHRHGERAGTVCETLSVEAGETEIPAVRHVRTVDAPARWVFELYNKLNYTSVIDNLSFLVEPVEVMSKAACGPGVRWLQVVWTVDRMPFPLRAIRDFVTLDMVHEGTGGSGKGK